MKKLAIATATPLASIQETRANAILFSGEFSGNGWTMLPGVSG